MRNFSKSSATGEIPGDLEQKTEGE